MLAKVWSAAIVGLDAVPIEVEVDIASGSLPAFKKDGTKMDIIGFQYQDLK